MDTTSLHEKNHLLWLTAVNRLRYVRATELTVAAYLATPYCWRRSAKNMATNIFTGS